MQKKTSFFCCLEKKLIAISVFFKKLAYKLTFDYDNGLNVFQHD
jgi:hypothetical protein